MLNSDARITIVMVNYYSGEFLSALIKNLLAESEFPELIHFLVVDNTCGADEHLKNAIALCAERVEVREHQPELMGSHAHASALNLALPLIESEYALCVDPDVYVFKHHWDSFLINELKTSSSISIGCCYPSWQLGKYHDFPSPVFSFFDVAKLKNLNADWTPFTENIFVYSYKFILRQFLRLGLFITRKKYENSSLLRSISMFFERIFGDCCMDTGWRLASAARKKKGSSLVFKVMMPESVDFAPEGREDVFANLAGNYELYYYKGEPMMTHKYSNHAWIWRTSRGSDPEFWRQCVAKFAE